jgi:N-acyl-D-amino-acid deacylase
MLDVLALGFFLQLQPFDILIQHARIVDGSGNPWYNGDVGIRGDNIVAIGRLDGVSSKLTIDARGLTVAPGFIDIHTHARRGIFEDPSAQNYIRQGVTTLIEGNDGSSPLPIAPFFEKLGAVRMAPNFGLFVGQGSIRQQVLGLENRKATPEEVVRMKDTARQAMQDGALGLSSGLFYVPGNFTPTEEVIEIAKVVAGFGGMYISHMRDEASGVVDSVRETIRIGEEGGLPTQVTHHKIIGQENWGKSVETLRLVEEARARGVDATIDAYPYTASSTGTGALVDRRLCWSVFRRLNNGLA